LFSFFFLIILRNLSKAKQFISSLFSLVFFGICLVYLVEQTISVLLHDIIATMIGFPMMSKKRRGLLDDHSNQLMVFWE